MIALLVEIGMLLVVAYGLLVGGMWHRYLWYPAAVALIIILFIGLLELRHSKGRTTYRTSLEIPLIIFFGWALLTAAFSINLSASIFELLRLGLILGFFFMVSYHLKDWSGERIFLIAIFIMAFIVTAYGLIDFFERVQVQRWSFLQPESSDRAVSGTFNNHNHFAGMLELSIFLGMGFLMANRNLKDLSKSEYLGHLLMVAVPLALMLLSLLFSLSRGGWLSFSVAFVVWLFVFNWALLKKYWWGAMLGVFMIASLIIFPAVKNKTTEPDDHLAERVELLTDRIETITEIGGAKEALTFNVRLKLWQSSLEIIAAHPLSGTGIGTYHSAFPHYRTPGILKGPRFAHQEYLHAAAEMGIPGLLILLWLLGKGFVRGISNFLQETDESRRAVLGGLWAGVFALCVHGLVDFNFHIPANVLIACVFMAVLTRRAQPSEQA